MKRFSSIAIFITIAVCLGFTLQCRLKGENGDAWKQTIGSDGYGYYSYLPCIFIYHKFDYDRVLSEEQKYNPGAYCSTSIVYQNKVEDKCFPGVALVLAPFFLIAYLLSYLLGYDTGGYGFLFQSSVAIGGLFYLCLGLIFLRKLMKEFGISELMSGLTLVLIVFGTNLFYYSTMEVCMSHVYSFGLTPIFLYYAYKSIQNFSSKNLMWMTVVMSILVLIRPINLLSLAFIPFLAGSYKDTLYCIHNFFKSKKIFVLLIVASCIIFIKFLLSYLQTGHFFVESYPGEEFNFKSPHFLQILFSYKKGWFIYTPLMFIAISGGLFVLLRKNVFRFFFAFFFFLLVTYVLSSWWSWWYGSGFGIRAFIDFYAVFALLLALFLNSLVLLWLKLFTIVILLLCTGLNLFQISQYRGGIIPFEGMNKEQYWQVFLKNEPSYSYLFNYSDTTQYKFIDSLSFKNTLENISPNATNASSPQKNNSSQKILISPENPDSPIFTVSGARVASLKNVYVYVGLWASMSKLEDDAKICVCINDKNGNRTFTAIKRFLAFIFEKNKRSKVYYIFELPQIKPDDNILVLINDGKSPLSIDHMEVKFCTPQ